MKKRLVTFLAAGVAATSIGVMSINDTASAATPREGVACVRSGVKFLASNGLLLKAAQGKVDYAPLDNTGGSGDIRTDLGDSAFLPLTQVIKLHYTNPELFSWCDRK
jgi:hypothetical protein